MANDTRKSENSKSGTLTPGNSLTNSGTVMVSSALAAVAAVDSTEHMAIILDPLGAGNGPEIAWITAHTAASTGATIVRGREGTSGVSHTSTTAWVHGPTAADYIFKCTSSTRPSTGGLPFKGMHIYETDTEKELIYNGTAWVSAYEDGVWTAFTPVVGGGWTKGNGTIVGKYLKIGRRVDVAIRFTLGSTSTASSGSGGLTISSLPVASASDMSAFGWATFYDTSAVQSYLGFASIAAGASTMSIGYQGAVTVSGSGPVLGVAAGAITPFDTDPSDVIEANITYESAS